MCGALYFISNTEKVDRFGLIGPPISHQWIVLEEQWKCLVYEQGASERTDGIQRQHNVSKLHLFKLLLIPSISQVNAVYL